MSILVSTNSVKRLFKMKIIYKSGSDISEKYKTVFVRILGTHKMNPTHSFRNKNRLGRKVIFKTIIHFNLTTSGQYFVLFLITDDLTGVGIFRTQARMECLENTVLN
jgi:hypothetical protein